MSDPAAETLLVSMLTGGPSDSPLSARLPETHARELAKLLTRAGA